MLLTTIICVILLLTYILFWCNIISDEKGNGKRQSVETGKEGKWGKERILNLDIICMAEQNIVEASG